MFPLPCRALRRVSCVVFPLAAAVWTAAPARAQFSIPGLTLPKVPGLNLPGMDSLLKTEEAVTTSVKDARGEVPFLDDYSPVTVKPLTALTRGPGGGWTLRPGLYGGDIRSYCLHAGTYGPTHGNGYLYAPLKGKRRGMIRAILHNSADHPSLPQHDIQSLVWAIEARAKFDALPDNLRQTAAILLPPQDILDLNGASVDALGEDARQQAFGRVSAELRPVFEAQNSLRGVFAQVSAPFDQLERIAVLSGSPPPDGKGRDIPGGRWTLHPGGFFVRFLPQNYSRTTLQCYVPEHFTIGRDAKGRIVSALDAAGNGVETDYNDTVSALGTSDSAVQGYTFAAIRVKKNGKVVRECRALGWTFVGMPGRDGVRCGEDARYPGSDARLAALVRDARGMDEFKKNFDKPSAGWGSPRRTVDLGSWRRGIAAALRLCPENAAAGEDDGAAWALEELIHAWQWEDCRWALGLPEDPLPGDAPPGSNDPSSNDPGSSEYDPSGDVAAPGENGRQRLGLSCVPFAEAA